MRIIRKPEVYLIGRQSVDGGELQRFLQDHEYVWEADTDRAGEHLAEIAGRLCYLSYGKGRRSNREYLEHILESGHGSVLEHAVWNFLLTGVTRSMTHELVRHRAGFGYSQLSQRYVNESDAAFVEPDIIATDPKLHDTWLKAVETTRDAYTALVDGLEQKFGSVEDKTLRRKMARQAARSVLPNAVETRIFVTANGRALRHFIEMRSSEHADVEIRSVAVAMLRIMQKESPNMFGDFEVFTLADGTEAARTRYRKV